MWKRTVSRPFLSGTPPNSFEFHIYLNLPEGGYPEISQQKNMFSMFMIPSRLLRHDHLLTGDNPVERPSSRSTRRVNPDFSDLCVQPGTDGLGTDTGRCRDGLVTIVPVIQLSNFWSKSISWTGGRPKLGAWMKLAVFLKLAFPETEPTIISWWLMYNVEFSRQFARGIISDISGTNEDCVVHPVWPKVTQAPNLCHHPSRPTKEGGERLKICHLSWLPWRKSKGSGRQALWCKAVGLNCGRDFFAAKWSGVGGS